MESVAAIAGAVVVVLAVLGGVLRAGVIWGKHSTKGAGDVEALRAAFTSQIAGLSSELTAARSAISALTERLERVTRELGRDVGRTDLHHRERWHEHDRWMSEIDKRVSILEDRLGVPQAVGRDTTDRISVGRREDTGRHRKPDDSG